MVREVVVRGRLSEGMGLDPRSEAAVIGDGEF